MNIDYTYEIVDVDVAAKCMVVVYTAEGHETMQIGAPLPFEGEVLEDVIRNYDPVPLWVSRVTPVTVPLVGTTGVISYNPPVTVPLVTGNIPVTEV